MNLIGEIVPKSSISGISGRSLIGEIVLKSSISSHSGGSLISNLLLKSVISSRSGTLLSGNTVSQRDNCILAGERHTTGNTILYYNGIFLCINSNLPNRASVITMLLRCAPIQLYRLLRISHSKDP